jgi:uncharacterized surface protein with fasciclin (FAS1) repeats
MEEEQTIAAIAAGDPRFSVLVDALGAAELTAALDGPDDDLTVFAPTNDAFAALAGDLGFEGDTQDAEAVLTFLTDALAGLDEGGDPIPALTEILLYHVSPGAKSAIAIENSETVETLAEASISPDSDFGRLVDEEPDLLDPEIVVENIEASNGLVQVIDRVLLPLDIPGNERDSIAGIVTGNPDFEVLELAVGAAGLGEGLAEPNEELTVFAPTDDAFAALATSLGFDGNPGIPESVFDFIADALAGLDPDGDPIPLLTDILSYHAVEGAFDAAALEAAPQVETTLEDAFVVLAEQGSLFDADPDVADPALVEGLTDIAASNGLVQAIDGVLLPLDLEDPAPEDTILDIVLASGEGFDDDGGDFDVLRTALQEVNLAESLGLPGDSFTVFAPTDAAFQSLATQLGGDGSTEAAAYASILGALTELSENANPEPLLASVLLYHVAEGALTRAELAASPELTTLFGVGPEVDGAGLSDADPGFADPAFLDAASDIVAANGLVHAIDEVLLPLNAPDESDLVGTDGDDTLVVEPETRVVEGGPGEDVAEFDAAAEEAAFDYIADGFAVTTGGRTVELFDVESFQFTDETVEVDRGELSASVFRLYAVGLGREGDVAGVTFWTEVAEEDGLGTVADAVLASREFADQFGGTVPADDDIVEAFYGNFLDREADEPGLDFWTEQVETGALDTSDLLLAFSESDEFRLLTEETTENGILLFA